MGMVITAIAIVLSLGIFILVSAITGLIVGPLLVSLTISLIVLTWSLVVAGIIAMIFRIREGAYGR